jgi:3-dehydroquinate synthase
VALGGGVIGDLGGFVAATYLRGVPYVQVPTTLAAQVDASIGGKTAVNHPLGKNLIGAFHQPRLVFSDIQVLSTLSRREYLSGLAEVIKYGVIADAAFFKFLEKEIESIVKREESALRHAIRRSCEIKASVVQEDEREGDRRRILNYGHTLGHALEAVTGYRRYLHGEAVSIGMGFAARLARNLGFCDRETENRQVRLIQRAGLPAVLPKTRIADILRAMKVDKKVKDGSIHFVLADKIGHVLIQPLSAKEVTGLLRS